MRPDRAPSRAPPRPAPPGRSPLPARAPRPSLPLSAAAVGPGGRRGRRRAGTARSLAALWATRLSGWTSRLAPRASRPAPQSQPAFVVSASSAATAAAASGPRASARAGTLALPFADWAERSRLGAREARAGGQGVPGPPPWSSGPEAGGCCARPPRWSPAPAGTPPARVGAAAKSARSTGPRALA